MNLKNNGPLKRLLKEYEAQYCNGAVAFFSAHAFQRIIDYFIEEQEWDKAVEATEQAIAQHAFSVEFYIKKAELLLGGNAFQEALETLAIAKLYAPMGIEVELLSAQALIGLGKFELAMDMLEEMKQQSTSADELGEILVTESLVHTRRGELEIAFYTLKMAIQVDANNMAAIESLAEAVENTRKYEEGIEIYEGLLDQDSYNARAWYHLGQAKAYLGHYEEALEAYDYAFVIDEGFYRACRACAELNFLLERFDKALTYFETLLNNIEAEADGDLHLDIGKCYLALGLFQSAQIFLQHALRLDPINEEMLFYIGRCYAKQDKWESALRYFQRAVDLDPVSEEYLAALGEAHYHTGSLVEAIAALEDAISLNEDQARNWVLLASALMEQGKTEEALAVLDEGEQYSLGAEITYCRIAFLMSVGRRQEALYRLAEALAEDYEGHHMLFEVFPGLEEDMSVISLIADYSGGI
jgi:tetratricopeptide (TPR) repeat protein